LGIAKATPEASIGTLTAEYGSALAVWAYIELGDASHQLDAGAILLGQELFNEGGLPCNGGCKEDPTSGPCQSHIKKTALLRKREMVWPGLYQP
jgi:hypothetical protein